MLKYAKCFVVLLVAAGIFSCEKQSSSVIPEEVVVGYEGIEPEKMSDGQFLSLAYDETYLCPESFFTDPAAPYGFYYVNTVSISPINNRDLSWIELSTNDKNEALNWLNLTINNSSERIETVLISENETEKYFEFECLQITDGIYEYPLLFRVHKKNYYYSIFDRFAPWNHDNETKYGYYNAEIEKTKVKECIEYLWTVLTFSHYGNKVLISKITETKDYFEVYICSFGVFYGDWGMHDTVNVYDNYIRFNKSSRLITFKKSLRKQILGHYRGGLGG